MTRGRLILFLLLFIQYGCRQEENIPAVFRYNEAADITSLDPAYARTKAHIWPVNQLYDGLLQLNKKLDPVPAIAKSWEISEDGKTYTFYLRDDVYFHDHPAFPGGKGRRVIAEDFFYSFNRILDPRVASSGYWIFSNLDYDASGKAGIIAQNDTTLLIKLKQPFAAFPGLLTMSYCKVVPHEVCEKSGRDFGMHPSGTGPFKFKLWEREEKLVLVRNDSYFEKDSSGRSLPYIEGVSIRFIKDKQSEFMEFMMGNLDLLSGMHPAYKDEIITPSGKLNPDYEDRFRMISLPYLNTEYLGFLLDTLGGTAANPQLLHPGVRKAINYGFDRKKMMRFLRNNIGTPAVNGFIPKGLPAHEPGFRGYYYAPDSSRSLLEKAGFPNGEGLEPVLLYTTADYLDLCEYIQHELAGLGIEIQIEILTGAAYRNLVAHSKLPFFRASWIADYPDAENYLALFYSENFSPAGPNYTHHSSPEYDRLYRQALSLNDPRQRQELYRQMDSMIISSSVVVPLFYDQVVRIIPDRIMNMEGNALNLLNLKTIKIN